MENTISLAFIILTKNESKHIVRCIESVKGIAEDILVVDCFSSDDTVELAKKAGARVVQHKWKNYATQFNYALNECGINTDWVWRLDADEYVEDKLGDEVKKYIQSAPENINGIYVKRRIDFMGKPLKHGGWYPTYHLKVFKRGHGECENRWTDEHIRLFDGETTIIKNGDQVDANLNDLTWWTEKHNGYANREIIDMLLMEYGLDEKFSKVKPKFWGTEEQRKRWLKVKYIKMPLFVRPYLNFIYRYFFKGGFLDGKRGFIWHTLQGFWYRMLVDAKVYEIKKQCNFDKEKIKEFIKSQIK